MGVDASTSDGVGAETLTPGPSPTRGEGSLKAGIVAEDETSPLAPLHCGGEGSFGTEGRGGRVCLVGVDASTSDGVGAETLTPGPSPTRGEGSLKAGIVAEMRGRWGGGGAFALDVMYGNLHSRGRGAPQSR